MVDDGIDNDAMLLQRAGSTDVYKRQPLSKVPDSAIKAVGMKRFEDDESDVAFLDPKADHSSEGQHQTVATA